nr:uncharacterized protein LOC120968199 [Aegilops tauschii subsp. strangulata]
MHTILASGVLPSPSTRATGELRPFQRPPRNSSSPGSTSSSRDQPWRPVKLSSIAASSNAASNDGPVLLPFPCFGSGAPHLPLCLRPPIRRHGASTGALHATSRDLPVHTRCCCLPVVIFKLAPAASSTFLARIRRRAVPESRAPAKPAT